VAEPEGFRIYRRWERRSGINERHQQGKQRVEKKTETQEGEDLGGRRRLQRITGKTRKKTKMKMRNSTPSLIEGRRFCLRKIEARWSRAHWESKKKKAEEGWVGLSLGRPG